MQAVLLAAGESSRFWPLSEGRHKSLFGIMGKPLIEWTIEAVKRAGIKDIIIVQNPSENIEKELGSGKAPGVSIRYATQKEPKGMGDAIMQAERMITGPLVVLNPYHLDAEEFIREMAAMSKKTGARMVLLGKKTKTPWNYGILALDKDKVLEIVEKPERGKEPSDVRAVGVYLLPKKFLQYCRRAPQSHYSFEDAISLYAKEFDARAVILEKETPTLKYPWDLFGFARQAMAGIKKKVAKTAKIEESAKIEGAVFIGENARIMENAVIKGPAYIGDNSIIGTGALIRESGIEASAVIGANAEVARSIIGGGTHIHSGYAGDSIIVENCRIGAGFITGNVRIDRGEIYSVVKGEKAATGLKSFGTVIGRNTKIGIGVKTMPGVMIGANCTIGPGTVVKENVESDSAYYSEFRGIVKKKRERND